MKVSPDGSFVDAVVGFELVAEVATLEALALDEQAQLVLEDRQFG